METLLRTLKKLAKEYQSQNFPMKQKSFKSWQIHIHYSEAFTFLHWLHYHRFYFNIFILQFA